MCIFIANLRWPYTAWPNCEIALVSCTYVYIWSFLNGQMWILLSRLWPWVGPCLSDNITLFDFFLSLLLVFLIIEHRIILEIESLVFQRNVQRCIGYHLIGIHCAHHIIYFLSFEAVVPTLQIFREAVIFIIFIRIFMWTFLIFMKLLI